MTVQIGAQEQKLFHEDLDHTDRNYQRTERASETLTIDGREVQARVFDATWKRLEMSFKERRWIVDGVAVRRELVETCPDGARVVRAERLVKWAAPLTVGEQKVACRRMEKSVRWKTGRTDENVWFSVAVPGHVVKRVRKNVNNGETSTETITVVAFGLR